MVYEIFEGAKDVKTVKRKEDEEFFEEARKTLGFKFDVDLIVFCVSIGLYKCALNHDETKQKAPGLKKLTSITTLDTRRLFDILILYFLKLEKGRMEEFELYFYTGFSILRRWFREKIQNLSSNPVEIFSALIGDIYKEVKSKPA